MSAHTIDAASTRQLCGCLIGGGVGDALGLPSEGLNRKRIASLWHGEWQHRLVFGRGMFSDDTEHASMTAASLIEHRDDVRAFSRALARRLRWWLVALPAGTGIATAKAILRLWLGFSPQHSGVRSAGNGPAMRSAIIGVVFANDAAKRREFALASCRITHTDPRAEEAAVIVAEAAALAARGASAQEVLATMEAEILSDEMRSRWTHLRSGLERKASVVEFAEAIGCGKAVSGFAPNTVAVVLYAWLLHRGDFRLAMTEALGCGGDTDTVGAILGGIAGIETGEDGIPREWLNGIADWPRSMGYLRCLSCAFEGAVAPRWFWPAVPLRNAVFLVVVLCHGFRRLLPPY